MLSTLLPYLTYLEVGIILYFIFRQSLYYGNTMKEVKTMRKIFARNNATIIHASVPEEKARTLLKDELHKLVLKADAGHRQQTDLFPTQQEEPSESTREDFWLRQIEDSIQANRVELTLLKPPNGANHIFTEIIASLNLYLLRNMHGQVDFSIARDLIERECENQEDKIYNGIQMPLYWGLLGTILGIVVGLVGLLLPGGGGEESVLGLIGGGQVNKLLVAVSIAMFGSFTGLYFTIRSTLAYKKGVAELNKGKNHFYHFLQTELLPTLPKTMASTIDRLQTTLEGFNTNFGRNLTNFDANIKSVHENLATQQDFLNQLADLDLNEIVQGNIKVFQELQKGASHFRRFFEYQEHLNLTIQKITRSASKLNDVSEKLENVIKELDFLKENSAQVVSTISEQQELFQNLSQIFDSDTELVQEWKNKIRREVENLDKIMQDNLEALEEHSKDHFASVKKVFDQEFVHLQKVFEQSQGRFQHLEHLKHLERLEAIQQSVNGAQSSAPIDKAVSKLNQTQEETNALLNAILKEQQREPFFPQLLKRFGYGKKEG